MCDINTQMNRKIVIITGGSSGIGLEAAKQLAKQGARVVIASKNETKLKKARDEIVNNSGSTNVAYKTLDFASLKSVRNFANEMMAESRIDVLINNAGSIGLPDRLTTDGLNLTMQVNFFGAFLLTYLLIPKLKASAPSRIINGLALAMFIGEIDFNHWNDVRRHSFIASGANSKLALALFTAELRNRLEGSRINVYSFDPFVVRDTDILEKVPAILKGISKFFVDEIGQSKKEAGKQIVYLASSSELNVVNGKHYMYCKEIFNHWLVYDFNLTRRLWEESKKAVKISAEEDWEVNNLSNYNY